MKFKKIIGFFFTAVLIISICNISSVYLFALDPPTKEQLEKYKSDGTLEMRIKKAISYGNNLVSPYLVNRLKNRLGVLNGINSNLPRDGGLPSKGDVKIPVLLISFSDFNNVNSLNSIQNKLFGSGVKDDYPLESLKEFYFRSSYGQLKISGNVLGWFRFPGSRDEIDETSYGRESLIKQALEYYDKKGHDFSQYDNDNDGDIDYIIVIWSGPHGEWSSFWWAYQTSFYDKGFKIDGKSLGVYSWQWESYRYPNDVFKPSTVIHETGHALGLPDLYDYKEGAGPEGGVGGLDIMASVWGDHNGFSKYLLDWNKPKVITSDSSEYSFSPVGNSGESLFIIPESNSGDKMFGEFFMVENRSRVGNDIEFPNDGLLIWHIDSTLNNVGNDFEYDNSYTEHKYIRLMEADGLEEIEKKQYADAGDFYNSGSEFGPATFPSSLAYNGDNTGIFVKDIFNEAGKISFSAGLKILVRIDLTGEKKEERAWIINREYGDLTFKYTKNGEVELSGFKILRQEGNDKFEELRYVEIDDVNGDTYSFIDDNLKKGYTYKYKVIAYDENGRVVGISKETEI